MYSYFCLLTLIPFVLSDHLMVYSSTADPPGAWLISRKGSGVDMEVAGRFTAVSGKGTGMDTMHDKENICRFTVIENHNSVSWSGNV